MLLLTSAAVVLAVAPPVTAAKEETNFTPPKDRSAWYWEPQIDMVVPPDEQTEQLCDTVPPAVPCAQQRVRLPSPQDLDTLPVAVVNGEQDKIYALYFNLTERGITAGAEITKFIFQITEGQTSRDVMRTFNAAEKRVEACLITDFWPEGQGDPQVFDTQPPYDASGCVEGHRFEGEPAIWEFNITELTATWGLDPFSNNGVMLVPVIEGDGPTESWQVNFKVPLRDRPETPKQDEGLASRDRIAARIEYEPAPPPPALPPPPSSTGGFTPPSFTPPTTEETVEPPAEEEPGEEAPPVVVTTTDESTPQLPGYVWLLIPIGLIALAAVRSVVLEPVGGTRTAGVIAAIRRQNAAKRGTSLEGAPVPLAGVRKIGAGIGAFVSKGLRMVRKP